MTKLPPYLEDAIAYVEGALADHTDRHGNNPASIVVAALRRAKAERNAAINNADDELRASLEIAGNTLVAVGKQLEQITGLVTAAITRIK